jgi:RNA polymerase sigma-70 factor (ECF subfamily)
VSTRRELQLLTEVLAKLPKRRIALERRRFGGSKLNEIAEHLEISITTAHGVIVNDGDYC